jgi:uncharacterized membrane protein
MFSSVYFHPMTVHFPIALVMVGFLADVLSIFFKKEKWLIKVGFYLMILGTIAVIVAYLTGAIFTKELTGAAHDLKERHEFFAGLAMWILLIGCAFRIFLVYKKLDESPLKWVPFFFYIIAVICVGITGYLGGAIVYDNLLKI